MLSFSENGTLNLVALNYTAQCTGTSRFSKSHVSRTYLIALPTTLIHSILRATDSIPIILDVPLEDTAC